MRKAPPRAAVALLLAALGLPARAEVQPYWNAQWGRPAGASAGLGLLAGRVEGEGFRLARRALLVEARPGLDAGALHVGLAPFAAASRAGFPFAGIAVKGTLLRTWGSPARALGPRQTYAGAELHAAWVVKASVGVLWRVSGRAGRASVLTWSVGIGL